MKVLDLQCLRGGHVFEGWFASEDDFQSQRDRALVQCPVCADAQIEKRLSAPRLNLGARPPAGAAQGAGATEASETTEGDGRSMSVSPVAGAASAHGVHGLPPALQAAWLQLARKIVANTEDVGARFADEARRMHHGETPERAIRGQATAAEAEQLLEEGVPVLPLVLPPAATETLQ